MRCSKVRKLFSAFIDGELKAGEAGDLERHVADCSACAREMASLRAAMAKVHILGNLAPSPAFVEGVMARLAAERRAGRGLRVGARVADFVESVFRRPAYQLAVLALVAFLVAFEVAAWAAGTMLSRPAVNPLSDDPHSAVTMQLKKIKKQSEVAVTSIGTETPILIVFPKQAPGESSV